MHIPVVLDHTWGCGGGAYLRFVGSYNCKETERREEGGGVRTFPLDHGFHFDCSLNMNECLKERGMIAYFEEPCWIDNRESV